MSKPAPWWERGLVRKAITRPLWWWHRRRLWPVRKRVFQLPAHEIKDGCTPNRLIMQATPAALADAAWSAYSFLHFLDQPGEPLGLSLFLDTSEEAAQAAATQRWQRLFPGSQVQSTRAAMDNLGARAPSLASFARGNPMGRKLLVLLDAQEQSGVLYADSDVLLLQFPPELARSMNQGGPPRFNLEDGPLNGDDRLLAHALDHGWKPPSSLNAGLLYIPRGALDVADAERLLAAGDFDPHSWFVEQTVVALLMTAAGAEALPPERYVVSTRGQFFGETDHDYQKIVTRHFTTPVRHLMYARGMPLLWRQWMKKSS